MSEILSALDRHAQARSAHWAIEGASLRLNYDRLAQEVNRLAGSLRKSRVASIAILADNGPEWIVADLACLQAGIPITPIPHFFSLQQIRHLLMSAGVDLVLTDRPDALQQLLQGAGIQFRGDSQAADLLTGFRLAGTEGVVLPERTAKVTFTSGSTGEPKGVCLSLPAMERVARSLVGVAGAEAEDRHLALLPYATLLENIGGVYAPLLAGATVVAPGLAAVGLSGASGLDVPRFVSAITESRAATCIMIPQMLHGLVAGLAAGLPRPGALRYVAVGGAPVSLHLLERAASAGVPAFEGYGLSEAASVVAVNTPAANRPGSVGRPLPHVDLRFAEDGEILVRGSLFEGYLGEPAGFDEGFWPTGDLGYLDEDGFLHLRGRKKHIFITAFGRNVAPEWVERELTIEPAIAQACVFGEARPFNVAVIVPREGCDERDVANAVAAANRRLPDYARVARFVLASEPFSVANGQWTGTGRPRRAAIGSAYAPQINALYEE